MSNKVEDSEGFIKVKFRRKKRKCKNKIPQIACSGISAPDIGYSEEFFKKLSNAKLDLLCSDFMHGFKTLLFEALTQCGLFKADFQSGSDACIFECDDKLSKNGDLTSIEEIVCYGLGSILSCVNARYQLAFLIILRGMFTPTPDVYLYDPVFGTQDISVLEKLNFNILGYNDQGKRTSVKPTIFFMPHCGKPLYNSVLWSNWSVDGLQKVVIIGNSFTNIIESVPKSKMKESLLHIFEAQSLMHEKPVPNNFKYSDIFNSMSVHTFPSDKLTAKPKNFWERKKEPLYSSDDEIITKNH